MTDTILLVGHGSRETSGNAEIETFADQWRTKHPDWRIEVCFIEFAEVMLDAGLARAAAGSRRVLVVPLILNAAGHVKMEIPEHIEEARAAHPGVEFLYAPHLTACDPILSILKRRLRKAMASLDMPDPTTTGVVLLGRGSSDRQANGEVAKMARWLMEESDHELVDIAFTGITWPRLERAVQRQVQLGMTQVVVLPYYLFTGTLIQRIGRQVENLKQQYPQVRFASSSYFGFEPEIFSLLDERVNALRAGKAGAAMECDGCKFREFAQEHGLGHHHHGDEHAHGPAHAPAHVHVHAPAAPAHGAAACGAAAACGHAGPGCGHGHDHAHDHDHDHAHPHAPATA
ncbi:sirohydrochlorin chelatase [Caldimonas tepidiphila]|uniref:sirohydrochlorin chelatase n=1 Tax=Caldimonas tepidiphila TaxID=2315841 RepID=UPI000E5BCC98|nr:sirohydrochlorin chelatase [Caldimonas tepidiphila]